MTREHKAFQSKCDFLLGLVRASNMIDEFTDADWMTITDRAQGCTETLKESGFSEAEAQELVMAFVWGLLVRGTFVDSEKHQVMENALVKIVERLEKIKEKLSEG